MKAKVLVVQKLATKHSLDDIAARIELGGTAHCDFVLFPEYMNGVFTIEEYDHVALLSFKSSLQRLAQKHHIAVVATFLEKTDNHYFNTAYLIDNHGTVKGVHRKIAMTKYYEAKALTSGTEMNVFPTEFGPVGILICRDLLYPQIAQRLATLGARIIFCPSYWAYNSTEYEPNATVVKTQYPVDADMRALLVLPQARAIENEVFFIVANAAGSRTVGTYFEQLCGYSCVASPLYGLLASLPNHEEGCIIQDLHFDLLHDSEETFSIRKTAPSFSFER